MTVPHERTPETDVGHIWLDGHPYRVSSIQADKSNIFARKVNQGDPTQDDHPIFTTDAQKDWSGGWLVLDKNPASDINKYWTSTCETQYPGLITLPALTQEFSAPDGEAGTPYIVGDFNGLIMVNWGNNLYGYSPNDLTSPTLIGDMGSNAIGLGQSFYDQDLTGQGPKNFYIPTNGGYVTVDSGNTLSQGTASETVVSFELHDQKIWRLDADGSLSWANALPALEADWTYDCSVPEEGTPRNLIAYIRMDREPCLVVVTDGQTWKHDFANHVLHKEDLWGPRGPYQGLASIKHRTALRISSRTDIARYDNNTISFDESLSSRNGLPNQYRGFITSMASGFNDFYALVQGFTSVEGTTETFDLNMGAPETFTLPPVTAENLLLRNNGNGWSYVWAGSGGVPSNVTTSNMPDFYSLWWGCGTTLFMQQLPTTYLNLDDPNAVKLPFAPSCIHYSSWTDWGWMSQPKILKMIETQLDNMQYEGHRVTFWYRTDEYEAAPVLLGYVTENGEKRWFLGQDTVEPWLKNGRGHYKGLRHEKAQLIIALERGDDETQAPVVKRHMMVCRKWLRPQRTWRIRLDLTQETQDWTLEQQREHLFAIADTQEAVVFQHEDDQIMVEVTLEDWSPSTGRDMRAQFMVVLTESIEESLELGT